MGAMALLVIDWYDLSPLSQWSRSGSLTCSNYPDFAAPSGRERGVSTLWICRSSADLGSRDQCNKSKGYKCCLFLPFSMSPESDISFSISHIVGVHIERLAPPAVVVVWFGKITFTYRNSRGGGGDGIHTIFLSHGDYYLPDAFSGGGRGRLQSFNIYRVWGWGARGVLGDGIYCRLLQTQPLRRQQYQKSATLSADGIFTRSPDGKILQVLAGVRRS